MGYVSVSTRQRILRRDKFRCIMCGQGSEDGAKLECDHRIPRSKGGTNEDENLQTVCAQCNKGKGGDYVENPVDTADIDRKLHESKVILRKIYDGGVKKVLVAFSGGKDSFVCLDLCKKVFDEVQCYFLYLVKGLRCEEQFLEFAERKYDVQIHRWPSHHALNNMRKNVYMNNLISNEKMPRIYQVDTERSIRRKTGIRWLCYGMRMQDSLQRRAMISSLGVVDTTGKRVYPIYRWHNDDVYAYLRATKTPIPCMYGSKLSANVSFEPHTLLYLNEHYPDDFNKMAKVFPFVKAQVARHEFKKRREETSYYQQDAEFYNGTLE